MTMKMRHFKLTSGEWLARVDGGHAAEGMTAAEAKAHCAAEYAVLPSTIQVVDVEDDTDPRVPPFVMPPPSPLDPDDDFDTIASILEKADVDITAAEFRIAALRIFRRLRRTGLLRRGVG